jgi:hypothetical protein|tara:strand:- start:967 stop:2067 length:1101 start_codon:yes stop_codon:yes gene_type:complete
MSNLLLNTIKPFRLSKRQIPTTQLSLLNTDLPIASGVPLKQLQLQKLWYGDIVVDGEFINLQYVPQDSPASQIGGRWTDMDATGKLEGKPLPTKRELLNSWDCNTDDYSITQSLYRINKHGFRAEQIRKEDGDNAIMFLGDSFTFGIGVADEDVWCHKVANKLGKRNWNVGLPGGCNQEMIMVLESFIESGYVPSQVVVMWTEPHRKLLFFGTKFGDVNLRVASDDPVNQLINNDLKSVSEGDWELSTFRPNDALSPVIIDDSHLPKHVTQMKAWTLMNEEHKWFDFYQQRQQLFATCKAHNIKVVEMHYLDQNATFCSNIDKESYEYVPFVAQGYGNRELGRDNAHWGPKSHDNAYKTCIKQINS